MKRIYADNAATTALDRRVMEAMLPYLTENFGNPSSHHFIGREAKRAIENARKDILSHLGAGELYFSSGGTESNNWAIKSTARSLKHFGKTHIITSAFEHHSVLNCCKELESQGFTVTYLRPNLAGIVDPETVMRAITPDTGLVSIMYANNELGTIQPIQKIAEICRNHDILFHADAVQAVGHLPLELEYVDMLSFSAHKFYGPKGVGGLWTRKGLVVFPFINGGDQEMGKRAGTENVAGIVGMAEALKLCHDETYVRELRNQLVDKLLEIDGASLNGCRDSSLPGIANICFSGVDGEALMLMLDLKGICVSAGAACTTGSQEPSHVLKAIGLSDEDAKSSVRFSLGRNNTETEVDEIVCAVKEIVDKIRKM